MTSGDHKLPTHYYQESLNFICQGKPIQSRHSLSKSSSALASSGQEGLKRSQEVHKSLNNVSPLCDNNLKPLHSPEWPQDGDTGPEVTNCGHLVTEFVDETLPHKIHCLDVETSVASTEPRGTKSFDSGNVSENVSSFGHPEMPAFKAQSADRLETRAPVVQKSYSDFLCGGRTPLSDPFTGHNRNSATYSVLCSSGSSSCSDGASSTTNDSGTASSPSDNQNNLTDVACAARDRNIPQCRLDSSTVQHNITVYTVPGTHQHGILGPKNSGNGFLNNGRMYHQPRYNIPGVMSCNDISDIRHSPPAMIVRNSCTLHCCRDYDLTAKVDDTIAAYCHSLPIPSVQFSPGLACSRNESAAGQPPPQFLSLPQPFTFPKLVSSVSESGLDAKKLMRCGRLAFSTPPISIEELSLHSSITDAPGQLIKNSETSSDNLRAADTKTKDVWTMTSMDYIPIYQKVPLNCRDAEVQTVIIMENKSVSTTPYSSGHLFSDAGVGLDLQCPKSPVGDVRWDEEGRTWEVYGAAVDPEVLGMAIQKHLEIQIEQHLQPSETSEENPAGQSTKGRRRSFRTVMNSLRHSNCCVRTSSAAE